MILQQLTHDRKCLSLDSVRQIDWKTIRLRSIRENERLIYIKINEN